MKQITVRRVREHCLEEATRLSRKRGVTVNTVLVEALEKGLGLDPEKTTNGLERFAGDSDFGPDWDARLEQLRQVNPEDWK
jgi:hypothetical protein